MKPGRKKLPKNVHLLHGTHRPDRHGDRDDQQIELPIKAPPCPRFLNKEARKEWRRIVRILKDKNVLTELDRAVMAQYCQLWSEMEKMGDEFQAAKHTQLRVCAAELGLTPSSRTSLIPGSSRKKENPFSEHKR